MEARATRANVGGHCFVWLSITFVESVWGAARARETLAVLGVILGVAFLRSAARERRAAWSLNDGDALLKRWRSWVARGVVGWAAVWRGLVELVLEPGHGNGIRLDIHHFGIDDWFFALGSFAFVGGCCSDGL